MKNNRMFTRDLNNEIKARRAGMRRKMSPPPNAMLQTKRARFDNSTSQPFSFNNDKLSQHHVTPTANSSRCDDNDMPLVSNNRIAFPPNMTENRSKENQPPSVNVHDNSKSNIFNNPNTQGNALKTANFRCESTQRIIPTTNSKDSVKKCLTLLDMEIEVPDDLKSNKSTPDMRNEMQDAHMCCTTVNERTIACNFCNILCGSFREFMNHFNIHNYLPHIYCEGCGCIIPTINSAFVKSHKCKKSIKSICDFCGLEIHRNNMAKHVNSVHGKNSTDYIFSCEYCGENYELMNLNEHLNKCKSLHKNQIFIDQCYL